MKNGETKEITEKNFWVTKTKVTQNSASWIETSLIVQTMIKTGDVVRDALGHHALSSHAGGGGVRGKLKWGNGKKRETGVSVEDRIRVGGRRGGDG